MQSVLGTVLDPAADKTLMTTLTVTLAMKGLLPVSLASIIIGCDVLLSLSAFYTSNPYFYSAILPQPQPLTVRAGDLIIAQFLPNDFLDLYALSCQFGWQHRAQTAAAKALEIKDLGRPSHGFNGMQDITALDHHRLLMYHYECGIAAKAIGSSLADARVVRRSKLQTSES
ncbi:hypothetical protein DFH29DRAFT_993581 [Suillus ampliporus]|nr:hypothetical protein DFH29DRAFT_993581 [Suillus ampliporus]